MSKPTKKAPATPAKKPPRAGSPRKTPLEEAARELAAAWGSTLVVAVASVADLEAGASAAPKKESPLARAARLANLALERAVLPKIAGEKRWGGALSFAALEATTKAPPGPRVGLYEVVASEWAGSARGTPPGEASPYAAWRAVGAQRFRHFLLDAMIANEEGEVGEPSFLEREDVRELERLFFEALGDKAPRCVLAADLARGALPDALDFDKAFVAVGEARVAAAWLYLSRLWG